MHDHLIIEGWAGRLCNNMTQLCHAIYLAEQTCSLLEIPPHDGLLETKNFDFTQGEKPRKGGYEQYRKVICSYFFWFSSGVMGIKDPDWNARRHILKTYVRPMLPKRLFPNAGKDELVIYIRSGDIFNPAAKKARLKPGQAAALSTTDGPLHRWWLRLKTGKLGGAATSMGISPLRRWWRLMQRLVRQQPKKKPRNRVNPNFVQPPLSFYKQIIESRRWSRIRIVAQDLENPVIPELLSTYSHIKFEQRDLEIDIATLLAAQHLVIGYGTFGITWALLSDHLKSLYCPSMPEQAFGELQPGEIEGVEIYAFKFKNYIPLGQWKATDNQKHLMLTHQVEDVIAVGRSEFFFKDFILSMQKRLRNFFRNVYFKGLTE
ncbi:MAG: hypothetical protein AAF921_11095 [Cyanobacteria bacterium P01_D01_bin.44]